MQQSAAASCEPMVDMVGLAERPQEMAKL